MNAHNPITNEAQCVETLSRALAASDEELYDAASDHLLRLIAEYVQYGTPLATEPARALGWDLSSG